MLPEPGTAAEPSLLLPASPWSSETGAVGVEPTHRDQGQPEVTDLSQQPVQCWLIGEPTGDGSLRAVAADLKAAKPVRPPVIEDPFNADLPPARLSLAVHGRSPRGRAVSLRCTDAHGAVHGDACSERECRSGSGIAAPVMRLSPEAVIAIPKVGARSSFLARYERLPGLGITRRCHAGGIFPA